MTTQNPIPASGAPETLFARLCAHIAPHDPGWRERLLPADDVELARYAGLAGLGAVDHLPASYLVCARGMGRDSAGLFRDLRFDTSIPRIVRLYEAFQHSEPDAINPELPVVGLFIVGDQLSLDLRSPSADPPIVETTQGEYWEPVSRSWEALVMQAAILRVEPRRLPHVRWYSHPARPRSERAAVHAALAAFGAHAGLQKAWPSDDRHHIFLSSAASLFAEHFPDGSLLLHAFADGPSFFAEVEEHLAPALKLTARGIARVIDGRLQNSQ